MIKFSIYTLVAMGVLALAIMFINMNVTVVLTMHPFWRFAMILSSLLIGVVKYKYDGN